MLTLSKSISQMPETEFRKWLDKRYPMYSSKWKSLHKGKRNPVKVKKDKEAE